MKYVPPIGGAEGDSYVDANPASGVQGSPVPAAAIEHAMREVVEVITAAGLTPDEEDLTQLRQAIAAMIAAGVPDLSALLAHLSDTSDPHGTIAALLAAANVWSAAQRYAPGDLAIASGAVAWDAAAAPVAMLTLTEDVTAITLTGEQPGCSYELTILQDATGGHSVTWPSAWRWPGGSAPDMSADGGAEDVITLSVRDHSGTPVVRAVAAQAFAEVS
jgi:hypothetical protein